MNSSPSKAQSTPQRTADMRTVHMTENKPTTDSSAEAQAKQVLAPMPQDLLGHIGQINTAQDWAPRLLVWLHERPQSEQSRQSLIAQLQRQLVQHPQPQLLLTGQGVRIQLHSMAPSADPDKPAATPSGHDNTRRWGVHSLHFIAQGQSPAWPGPWPAGVTTKSQGAQSTQTQQPARTPVPGSAQELLQRLQVDPEEAMVMDALLSCQVMGPRDLPLGVTATFDAQTGQMQELLLTRLAPWTATATTGQTTTPTSTKPTPKQERA